MAGAHQLGSFRRRCVCACFGFLQSASRLDDAAHAYWKVFEVLDMEFDIRLFVKQQAVFMWMLSQNMTTMKR